MKNNYGFDSDLNPVLGLASDEELGHLVGIMLEKWSEMLTIDPLYKEHSPNHSMYPDLIAKELRDFGGQTFVTLFRGEGPSYHEIVCDVAKKLKAPYKKTQSLERIEESIISTVLEEAWENMSEEEREELLKEFKISGKSVMVSGGAALAQLLFKLGGFKSYQLLVIVANAVAKQLFGKALAFGANTGLVKTAAIITGPIGIAVGGLWTLLDIGSESYKVTIPSVIYIAALRIKYNTETCNKCNADLPKIEMKFCPECGARI